MKHLDFESKLICLTSTSASSPGAICPNGWGMRAINLKWLYVVTLLPSIYTGPRIRQFRERTRFLNASLENVHRSRRAKKVRAQTFYPCPPPSGSEHDRYGDSNSSPSSSTVSSESDNDTDFEDDKFSIDSSGYINTLVREIHFNWRLTARGMASRLDRWNGW